MDGNKNCDVKFSIVIPVYNVEFYLPQCLDSILPAITDADEIRLVQGPSGDRSRKISLEYQAQYKSIQILDQNEKGLSNARNCGLQTALGDYILFMDSDDFVDTKTLARLLDAIRNRKYTADLIMTDFYRYFEPSGCTRFIRQIGDRTLTGMDALPQIILGRECFWNVWRNIYRRSFLMEHSLFFKEHTHGEDIEYMTRMFLAEPDLLCVDAPFYYYRMGRKESLMNTDALARVSETAGVLEKSISSLRESDSLWAQAVISGFQLEYLRNLAILQEVPENQRKAAADFACNYREVLRPARDPLARMLAKGLDLLGVSGMARILALAKRMKRKREHRIP